MVWRVHNSVGFIFLLFVCSLAIGQDGPYRITGHIISPDNEALPNANILFNNEKVLISDEHGDFIIRGLKRGKYTIEVFYIGFDSLRITVSLVNKNEHLDIKLPYSDLQLREVVVIGDHFKTGRIEQSQTIQTVNQNFLQQQNAGTLINSLQKLPGISSINTGVGIAKPVIRGMSFNRVLVLDKGIRQEGQQWGLDHGLEIDQYDAERLEIVKGPSSLLYGSDGLGGVVRILPPAVPLDEHLDGETFLTYKNNNGLLGTSTKLQGKKSGKFFRLRFSTQDFGDYAVPAERFTYNTYVYEIHNNRLKNTAGKERNLSFTGGLTKKWGNTSLTVSNFNQRAGLFPGATGEPRGYLLEDDSNKRNIDFPRQQINHLKVVSNTSLYLGNNWLELDLGYQFNDRKEEGKPHSHGYQPTPDGDLALGLKLRTYSLNMRYYHKFSESVNGAYGIQGQYQENQRAGFEFFLADYRAYQTGAFAYYEYSPNHLMTYNLGLRYDFGNTNISEFREPNYATVSPDDSVLRNPDIHRMFHNYSAAIGLSYYPDIYFNIKANLGSSFRMPTPVDLAANGVHHALSRYELGHPDLQSERGIQLDLNLTYKQNGLYTYLSPFLGYYYNYLYLKPLPYFVPTSQESPQFAEFPLKPVHPVARQVYHYTQNNALFTGLEFNIEYDWNHTWFFRSASEYVWNKNLDTKLPLPFTPPFSIYGEIEYQKHLSKKAVSKISALINFHHYSAQSRTDRNENATPGYRLFTVSIGGNFKLMQQEFEMRISGNNLLNTNYMNHLSRYRLLNLPEQGRNIMFSLRIPFKII